jgi:hypothetical protein
MKISVATSGSLRTEIERYALNLDGLQSVQRTACDGAGWTNYVPLTP